MENNKQQTPTRGPYPCSTCGRPLMWIQHYQQWWCPVCQKYEGWAGYTQPYPQHLGYQSTPMGQPCTTDPLGNPQPTNVNGLSAVGYQGPRIIYKIKVENPGPEPICDVRVSVFFPKDAFLIDSQEKNISLLQPNESNTATFSLRPTGECGKRSLSGEIDFYDYGSSCRKKVSVKPREVEVLCPVLSPMALDDSSWKLLTQRLVSSQDETNDIPMGAEALSKIVFKALQEFNMAPMEQVKTPDGALVHIINRFAAVGIKGLEYAARLEVLGGPRKSRVLLSCYAKNDIALTGFHHAIIDIIEKRTLVKKYLTDNIVIQHIKGDLVAGDKITIKDSVIQRSKIG